VVVGIVAGELAISALGGGYGTLALATFTAMAVREWRRWSTRVSAPASLTCSVAAACCSRGPP
jgi:hypothetical protein